MISESTWMQYCWIMKIIASLDVGVGHQAITWIKADSLLVASGPCLTIFREI